MQLTPLSRDAFVLEKPLPAAIYDERGVLLLRAGYVFHSEELLAAFLARPLCRRDEEAGGAPVTSIPSLSGPVNPFDLIIRATRKLGNLMRLRRPAQLGASIARICLLLQTACSIDQDAAIASLLLVRSASYHIKHAIDTAIMVEIVARAMGLPANDRTSILSAALTMNIGMARAQDQLDGQLSSLTAEQLQLVRQHPVEGHRLLQQAGVTDPIWLEAVLHHHELPDGSGYPEQLQSGTISLGSALIGTLDTYCALVVGSGHRLRQLPRQVMQDIFKRRGTRYGEEIPAWLVKEVGLYPPGTLVSLASGEAAVVIRKGASLQHPLAMAMRDANGELLPAPQLRDTADEAFAVKDVSLARESDFELDLDPAELWPLWNAEAPTQAAPATAG